jgi:hypothetical protein
MSQFHVEARSAIAGIEVESEVRIPNPLLKRLLISSVADCLENNQSCDFEKKDFLDDVKRQIASHGIESLTRFPIISAELIPDGVERVLLETNRMWQLWFGENTETHQTFRIKQSLSHQCLVGGFASAIRLGYTDDDDEVPETADPKFVLDVIVAARINRGSEFESSNDGPSDYCYELAEVVVKHAFPHLFAAVQFSETCVKMEQLEF